MEYLTDSQDTDEIKFFFLLSERKSPSWYLTDPLDPCPCCLLHWHPPLEAGSLLLLRHRRCLVCAIDVGRLQRNVSTYYRLSGFAREPIYLNVLLS